MTIPGEDDYHSYAIVDVDGSGLEDGLPTGGDFYYYNPGTETIVPGSEYEYWLEYY